MKQKQKISLLVGVIIVVITVLVLGVFLAANKRGNVAKSNTNTLISELTQSQNILVTKGSSDCLNVGNGIVKTVFRHRVCMASKSAYFFTSGNQNDIEKSLYATVTSNGWSLLDSNRGDDNSFFGGYLDAITNINGVESNLTIRLLPSDKIDQLNELSSSERAKLQSGAISSKYIVAVYVMSRFEG